MNIESEGEEFKEREPKVVTVDDNFENRKLGQIKTRRTQNALLSPNNQHSMSSFASKASVNSQRGFLSPSYNMTSKQSLFKEPSPVKNLKEFEIIDEKEECDQEIQDKARPAYSQFEDKVKVRPPKKQNILTSKVGKRRRFLSKEYRDANCNKADAVKRVIIIEERPDEKQSPKLVSLKNHKPMKGYTNYMFSPSRQNPEMKKSSMQNKNIFKSFYKTSQNKLNQAKQSVKGFYMYKIL